MDNNPKNNEFDNDIDEVLQIFKKNNEPETQSTARENSLEGEHKSCKERNTPDVTSDATIVNFEPVKPVKKTIPQTNSISNDDSIRKQNVQADKKPVSHEQSKSQSNAKAISLDDFNTEDSTAKKKSYGPDATLKDILSAIWNNSLTKFVLYIVFVVACVYILSTTVINVGNDVFAFVKDNTEITVIIPENADTADVAGILHKAGVIRYPFVFKHYAAFRISRRSYLTGEYLSGEQTVNPMMNYDTLINTLSDYPRSSNDTVRITIPEGLTVDETIELLVKNGVGKKEDYLEALQTFKYEYKFAELLTEDNISEHRFNTDMSYRLEGYLFPDTYDFYLNENPISALNKLLVNFNKKFEEEFYQRCEDLGMTVDEVITLASLIEKEGNNAEDYYYISSVFHNRLKSTAFPYLNSDASLQYALKEREGLYGLDTSFDHPYNTYVYKGLPPGPICNPGIEAIYAALYPESTQYYYFYTQKNGITVYSKTYEQHQRYVNADKQR